LVTRKEKDKNSRDTGSERGGREEPLTPPEKSPALYSVWEETVDKWIQYSDHWEADFKKLPTSKFTVQ